MYTNDKRSIAEKVCTCSLHPHMLVRFNVACGTSFRSSDAAAYNRMVESIYCTVSIRHYIIESYG